MPNRLAKETSPYLLQHANNPVDWYPWGDEALEKAKKENKLVLVSIGYSACHWCHVMEHESFEDAQVARLMNEHFVCIKVDREERPDVDHLYMDALHLMSGRGGWPLNCFTLPNGKPIYGGTYFPKENWMEVLLSLNNLYQTEPEKVLRFASELEKGLINISAVPDFKAEEQAITIEFIDDMVKKMEPSFDKTYGGYGNAPKFPMPNNYEFLLYYSYVLKHLNREEESQSILDHICLTLDKMAMGGIYDQLEGGFARYSTDTIWKAPHFEKMLYDNGQLMSLYANAYKVTGKKLYKEVVMGIYSFVTRQLHSPEGGFYCALDADSEGKEGEYYVWKKQELELLIGHDFTLLADYYSVGDGDEWEEGKFILHRKLDDESFCKKHGLTPELLENKKKLWIDMLAPYRQKRVSPGLDDKILASWNGLMLKGLVDAYNALGDVSFLDTAIKNANFICDKLLATDGSLWRNYKNEKVFIPAFLDDYAFVADALFELYQSTFDEKWLKHSENLVKWTLQHFYDSNKNIFYYTANYHKSIIARKIEVSDNVIPASNSAMANLLYKIGHCLANEEHIKIATNILATVKDSMQGYPFGYTNWGILALSEFCWFYEVAITGEHALQYSGSLHERYLPNKIMLGTSTHSGLELLKDKPADGKTLIFVCENKTCFAPVNSPEEAIPNIERIK
jgi:uncharacterized protein YyaL (SSP411 family)